MSETGTFTETNETQLIAQETAAQQTCDQKSGLQECEMSSSKPGRNLVTAEACFRTCYGAHVRPRGNTQGRRILPQITEYPHQSKNLNNYMAMDFCC
jgi:hypothetical protein